MSEHAATIPIKVIPNVVTTEYLSEPSPDLARSMGGNNAFYHPCEIYGGRNNFAVCLHTIDCVKEERMTLRSDCVGAIQAGTCPALKMRAEEVEKGYSIYFWDRAEQIRMNDEREQRMQNLYGYRSQKQGATLPKFSPTDPNTIADAAEPARKAKTTTPAAKPAPKTGFDGDVAGRNLIEEGINRSL